MNIAVLIKHVVDSTEVRFDKKSGELRLRGLPEKISDYDKHAIEAAVQIKAKHGGKVTAISFGTKDALKSLKEAVALGADEGVLVHHAQAGELYDPILVAQVLAKATGHLGGFDLVLSGSMTEDVTNKIVGSAVASYLNLPYLSNVSKLAVEEGGYVSATSEIDGWEVETKSRLPIALSVMRKLNEPRLATKIQIMKVPMKALSTVSLGDIGMSEELSTIAGFEVASFTPIPSDRKRIIIEDEVQAGVGKLVGFLREEGVL
ncbi:electron transfer flavoprotein subunit beta/FixA family protein [Geobacter grbiciae]|uniref:electron transfer flavoprotein subunit beta/FixA family protein n=1 Tax=Geobacter grbiciae TaxID=155042 RepID=UPI001C016B87|nr:electron transfer flavoprotein subunit beta/FixA family protein [Geobacter grbiciae]MBT1076458.1 electron transfer flavoprotein subunit beta/FixA family protein [Geobacter grbiciae]